MKQRQSMGGVGLLILMLLVIMFFSLKVPGMATERELSYPEFMVYLENKTVESAQIRPNREVPTGEVIFETTSGDREEFNVLDVKEVEMALRKAGVPYTTTSVRQDSYFMTVILPIALSAGVLIFLFIFTEIIRIYVSVQLLRCKKNGALMMLSGWRIVFPIGKARLRRPLRYKKMLCRKFLTQHFLV